MQASMMCQLQCPSVILQSKLLIDIERKFRFIDLNTYFVLVVVGLGHVGGVTCLTRLSDELFASGGEDGMVYMYVNGHDFHPSRYVFTLLNSHLISAVLFCIYTYLSTNIIIDIVVISSTTTTTTTTLFQLVAIQQPAPAQAQSAQHCRSSW